MGRIVCADGWILPGLVAMSLAGGWFLPRVAVAEDKRSIVAVMEIEDRSGKFSAKDVRAATDYLRGGLTESGRYIVIDETRQAAALAEMVSESKKASYKQCRARECQVPLGQALSADSILRTTIIHLGGVFSIQAELIDLSKEAAIKGAKVNFERTPGRTEARALVGALETLVQEIVAAPQSTAPPIPPRTLEVATNPDNREGSAAPHAKPVFPESKDSGIFQQWWFWTAVGVGGVLVAVLVLSGGDDGPSGSPQEIPFN